MTESRGTVVIGLGNPLMGDDGLGLAMLGELRRWAFTPAVEFVDGGTWGMNLLHIVEHAERLLLLDAIHFGAAHGRLITLRDDEIPRYLSHKVSPHQIDLREVLAVAELRGRLPADLVAVGLEPALVEMRTALSPTLARQLPLVVKQARYILREWGHHARLISGERVAYA